MFIINCLNLSDVYGVAEFESCGFLKNTTIEMSLERNTVFSSNKTIHYIPVTIIGSRGNL